MVDVFGDLKDMTGTEDMAEMADMEIAMEDMTEVERDAEATKNGVSNEADEEKREQSVVIGGRS